MHLSLFFLSFHLSFSLKYTHTQKQESKKLLSAYFLHTCTIVDLHFIETLTLLHSIHLLIFVSLLFQNVLRSDCVRKNFMIFVDGAFISRARHIILWTDLCVMMAAMTSSFDLVSISRVHTFQRIKSVCCRLGVGTTYIHTCMINYIFLKHSSQQT